MFLRPLYRRPVTDTVTDESIIFITWAFYITIKNNFDALAQQIKTVVDIFSKLGGSIAFLIKILAITLLPWLALTYAFWGYRRLSVGWSLLQGRG